MLLWLQSNLGTIIVALVVAVLFGAVIAKMIKDKKAGKSSCGGSCEMCGMAGACHGAQKKGGK